MCLQQAEKLVGRKGRQNSKTANSVDCSSIKHADARAAERANLPTNAPPNPTSNFSGISLVGFHLNFSGLAGRALRSKGDELRTAALFAVTSSPDGEAVFLQPSPYTRLLSSHRNCGRLRSRPLL